MNRFRARKAGPSKSPSVYRTRLVQLLATAVVACAIVPIVGVAPAFASCGDQGWHYQIQSSEIGARFGQIGPTATDYNGTNNNASMNLSASASGTVSESFSVGLSAGVQLFIFNAAANVDATIAHSKSLTFTNSITITVPAKSYGNGGYGWYKSYFSGHLFHVNSTCHIDTDKGTVVYKAPRNQQGWCTWISTTGAGQQRPLRCRA